MPHTNDSPSGPPCRPDEHYQPRIEPTDGDVSWLSVIESIVNPGQMEPGEDFLGSAHIETPLEQRTLPLYRIAGSQVMRVD